MEHKATTRFRRISLRSAPCRPLGLVPLRHPERLRVDAATVARAAASSGTALNAGDRPPVGGLPSVPRRSSTRWALRSEWRGGLERVRGADLVPLPRLRDKSVPVGAREGEGCGAPRDAAACPRHRIAALLPARSRVLHFTTALRQSAQLARGRDRGARRGCGIGVGEGSQFVRGDSDGDGGNAAASRGDGGDGRERARWTGSVAVCRCRELS
jgi:hypothetical protein